MKYKRKSTEEVTELSKQFFLNLFTVCGVFEKLRNFRAHVRNSLGVHDPRKVGAILYPYEDLFCVILLAGMAGLKTKDEIFDFWNINLDKLRAIFPDLPYVCASTSTITRAQRLLDASVLEDEYVKLFGMEYNLIRMANGSYTATDLLKRDVIASDGQALRSTARLQKDGSKSTPFEITSMVSYSTGITIGQVIHNKKNQEKKAILKLSDKTDIKNAILTWDAINTYAPLIDDVVSKGADVCVRLKRNQDSLHDWCMDKYALYKKQKDQNVFFRKYPPQTAQRCDKTGGKIYDRTITVFDADKILDDKEKSKWKNIKTVAFIDTICANAITGRKSTSTSVVISSIAFDLEKYPNLASDLLEISIRHWCVETNHWHLDEYFDQDGASFESQNAAFFSTAVSKLVLSMFNFAKSAYNNAENHYEGVCTTPKLQRACLNIEYSALLIDSFLTNNPSQLTEDELSCKYHFMKKAEDLPQPSAEDIVVRYEWEIGGIVSKCPLADLVKARGFRKYRCS